MPYFNSPYFNPEYFAPDWFGGEVSTDVDCTVDVTLPLPVCASAAILIDVADYTDSKPGPSVWPAGALSAGWGYLSPLITPEQLVARFLWGINLQSKFQNPLTGKPWEITTDLLQDWIEGALEQAEAELNIAIIPIQVNEKLPMARRDWEANGYLCATKAFPIVSIERMSIKFANDDELWVIPMNWIETANFQFGQINLLPATAAAPLTSNNNTNLQSGNLLFFDTWSRNRWIQALVDITYTAGFKNGVPRVVNDFIGTMAAIDIISKLLATYARSVSASLGIDSMNQSTSAINPIFLRGRLDDLIAERERMKKRLKGKLRHLVSNAI